LSESDITSLIVAYFYIICILTLEPALNRFAINRAPNAAHRQSSHGGEEACYDCLLALPPEEDQGQHHTPEPQPP